MKQELIDLIEKTRQDNRLSKTQMAKELKMSQSVYSRKTSGEYSFSIDDLRTFIIRFQPKGEAINKILGL